MAMSKSLFGIDQERLHRANTGRESIAHKKPIRLTIIEVIANYRQLKDLKPSSQAIIVEHNLVESIDTEVFVSGLHFLVRTDDGRYAIIASPKNEHELRSFYGSDDNLVGNAIFVDTLNGDLSSIDKKSIRFESSEYYYLEDNDRYMPVSIGNIYGSKSDPKSKLPAFEKNSLSGRGNF